MSRVTHSEPGLPMTKLHKIVHGRDGRWAGPCEHLNNRSAGFLESVGKSPQTFVRSHVQRKQHGEIEG